MNKIIILTLVLILSLSSVSAVNWYVDNAVATSGTGQSWSTAWKNLANINWVSVKPGDTVYISGGTTSKTYYESLYPLASGTANNPIKITRGITAGHTGTPIISVTGTTSRALWLTRSSNNNQNYLEVSYLKFKGERADGIIVIGSQSYNSTYGTVLSHNEIEHPLGLGIKVENVYNTKILNNYIYTGPTDFNDDVDGIYVAGPGNNIEIGFNKIFAQSTRGDAGVVGAHNDGIQISSSPKDRLIAWGTGGVTSIHDNFLLQNPPSYINQTAGMFLNSLDGDYQIHNNILVNTAGTWNHMIYLGNNGVTTRHITANVTNNTIVLNNGLMYPFETKGVYSASFRNNKIYKPAGDHAIFIRDTNTILDIDYNHYYLKSTTLKQVSFGSVSKSWSEWQNMGYDLHSTIGPFSFVNIWGTNPEDYKIVSGETASYHPADLNTDGCISLGEISTYVGRWLNGEITLSTVSSGVSKWVGGC